MSGDECIGGWTTETLHRHLKALLNERRIQVDERFRQIENATNHAERLLSEWKITTNEYRASFLTREEYRAEHQTLANKIDSLFNQLDQKLSFIDKERSVIKDDVTVIKSRAGYVSTALVIAIGSGVITILLNGIMLWHGVVK